RSAHPRHLHSFPTRRSSDLAIVDIFTEKQTEDLYIAGLRKQPPGYRLICAIGFVRIGLLLPGGQQLQLRQLLGEERAVASLGLRDRKSTRLNSSHDQISYAV